MVKFYLYLLFALTGGMAVPVQAGINNQLKVYTGNAVWAAMASFGVGYLTLLLYYFVTRLPWPSLNAISHTPWWAWLGGVLGSFYVVATVVLTPKLGAATTFGTFIAGQILASLLLDNWGFIGLPVHPLNLGRIAGAVLLVLGVVIVRIF